jgi:large subunit ribosomal protein L10
MPTQQKVDTVAEIKEKFSSSGAVILADYRGLSVKEIQALRNKLREVGSELRVYKNSLAEIAIRELELPDMTGLLEGPTAFAFGDEPVAPAKALVDFAREHTALEVKGGFVEHEIVDAAGIKAVAMLPSREQLLAMLLGTMQNPMASFVRVINGPAAAFARVVQGIADQKAAA